MSKIKNAILPAHPSPIIPDQFGNAICHLGLSKMEYAVIQIAAAKSVHAVANGLTPDQIVDEAMEIASIITERFDLVALDNKSNERTIING